MLVADSQLGVLASIPVLALLGPVCGAAYGAVAALRRRARGLYAFGPWINACCCATSAVVGVLGAYFLWGVITGFAFGAFWQ
jgi:hypothetical protein